MLDELRRAVCQANLDLVGRGLVIETWGNVSGIDRASGLMVIKPSGVPYAKLTPARMAVVSLDSGKAVAAGRSRRVGLPSPSSDTPAHLELYRAFAGIGGVVHTHSLYATAWAQARRDIPVLGTTHADYFCDAVPCTRPLTAAEIAGDYEAATGRVIVERFAGLGPGGAARDPLDLPACLVAEHGPFAWGVSPADAVANAAVLEQVARLASETLRVDPLAGPIRGELLDKHFRRKHGPGAYYGQGRGR